MIQINNKLKALAEEGKSIKVGLIGAGQMGRGMTNQIETMKGMETSVLVDINLDLATKAFENAGIPADDIKKVSTVSEANKWLEAGKRIVTDNQEVVSRADIVDVCIDATGVPEVGAVMAYDAIQNRKHVVMLNVETDVVIGPLLNKMAQSNGVVYTGSAGDEPGAVMELYDFADAIGLEVRCMGKGKNNVVVAGCTPETVHEEAMRRGVSPKMLCAFKDGTKTMVEMTAMSNATGLIPDIMGGHGPVATLKEMPKLLSLKEEGGIMNRYGTVEYINGIAPGVFVMVSSESEEVHYQMNYHSMGEGPNYILYRPFHLCNLETPISVARAYLEGRPTIIPKGGLVSETVTIAKKDLKAGELLDGIGGFTVFGSICEYNEAKSKNAFPLGLVTPRTKMVKDVKAGEIVTYDSVAVDADSVIFHMRKIQDKMFN